MTDESKALPDWKPDDGCVPDEWLVALRDNLLTEEQGDLLTGRGHQWCFECMYRYGDLVSDKVACSDAETRVTWRPEDGCIPIEILLAIHMEQFCEETELRLFAHIAHCRKCDLRLGYLPPPKRNGPTLLKRLRNASRPFTPAERRRMFKRLLRRWRRAP
jgi:hypothetical protein